MHAYGEMISATSTDYAPWYAIPADDKPYMRTQVAKIIADKLKSLGLKYPNVSDKEKADFTRYEEMLLSE